MLSGNRGASRKVHQPVANGVDDEFGRFVDSEGVHDIGAVNGNGVDAEIELGGDFLVGFARDDVLEDFEFARREAGVTLALKIAGARDLRIEQGFSFGNLLDGGDQVEIHGIFQNVATRAGLERLADQRVFGMHAEHENGDVREFREDAARGFDAVAGFADDLNRRLVFQHAAESATHQGVVVHQQYGELIRHEVPLARAEYPDAAACHRQTAAKC